MTRLRVLAPLALLLSACDWMQPRVDQPRREYVRVRPPPLDSLRAAPETIRIGGLRFAAGAGLWLNLMPGPRVGESYDGPPRSPLLGTIEVHPVDALGAPPLPVGLALGGAWLRAGDSVWPIAVAPSDTTRAGSTRLAHDVRGGPAWLGRDSRVDLVLRVRGPDGASRLVQVRGVHVTAAE